MNRLSQLPNIGEELERQLIAVGIETPEQLANTGSRQAWLSIKAVDPSACYNRLCALQGAIENIRWHHLSPETKVELKEFYNQYNL